MTAEEIIDKKIYVTQDGGEDVHDSVFKVKDAMVEFAEYHVNAAIQAIIANVQLYNAESQTGMSNFMKFNKDRDYSIDKNSILSAYSLDNIE